MDQLIQEKKQMLAKMVYVPSTYSTVLKLNIAISFTLLISSLFTPRFPSFLMFLPFFIVISTMRYIKKFHSVLEYLMFFVLVLCIVFLINWTQYLSVFIIFGVGFIFSHFYCRYFEYNYRFIPFKKRRDALENEINALMLEKQIIQIER